MTKTLHRTQKHRTFSAFEFEKGRVLNLRRSPIEKSLGSVAKNPLRLKTPDSRAFRSESAEPQKRPAVVGHPSVYESIKAKIEEFKDLKKGWDSYHAGPPSSLSILNAQNLIDQLERRSVPIRIEQVIPTSEESILISFTYNDKTIDFEIDPDGDIGALVTKGNQDPVCHDISAQEIAKFVNQLDD